MPERDQMVDCDPDAMVDVDVHEAHLGVVGTAADHHERKAVIPQQGGTTVIDQHLEQDDAVDLAAAEECRSIVVAQRAGDDVDRVAGVLDAEGGGHDHPVGRRVESAGTWRAMSPLRPDRIWRHAL